MGISSRDYTRERPTFRPEWGGFTPGCKWILIATIATYVLEVLFVLPGSRARGGSAAFIDEWLQLAPHDLLYGQIWRLATYALCHDRFSPWHILMNMLFLWMMGTQLERLRGTAEFVTFYFASAIFAGLSFVAFQFAMGGAESAIGASGAVMAILMLYACYHPDTVLYFFFLPIPIWLLILFYIVIDLHPILMQLSGDPVRSEVAHAAHLAGLLFGWLYYRGSWHLHSYVEQFQPDNVRRSWRQMQTRRRLKVIAAETQAHEELSEKVDAILAKISEQGESSLTPQERAVLEKAARAFREQRK